MRVHANIHLRVGSHLWQVDHLLPECPAQHRRLPGADHPEPKTTQLHIAAAHNDRGALAQAAFLRRLFGHFAQHAAGLFDRRENIGAQSGHIQQGRPPVTGKQIEHAGRASVGRIDRQPAGKARRQPVADHGDRGRVAIDIRAMMRQPQQAWHGAQGQRLPGDVIDFGFKLIIVDLFEFGDFPAGAGVDVSAGPDGVTVLVVQHDAFAHGTAGDGFDIRTGKTRALQRLANALAGQLPVGREIELHGARHVFHAQVFPFRLADGDLSSG